MGKSNKQMGILVTAIAAVLALIIIGGVLLYNHNKDTTGMSRNNPGAIDLTGYPNTGDITIRSASDIFTKDGKIDGYLVSVSSKGYKGNILMDITFDKTGDNVKSIVIKDNKESKGYGDQITEDTFLSQFYKKTAPFSLSGVASNPATEDSTEEAQVPETETADTQTTDSVTTDSDTAINTSSDTAAAAWADGTYEAEEPEYDDQGFKDKVTLTIQDGKMTEVIWDAYNSNGELKSVLSADGIYEIPDSSSTWQEQAIAITDFLIQKQSTDAITMDEDGKTDAVTGVTISVNDFIKLVKDCLAKSVSEGTTKDTVEGQTIDNPSGTPTDSSTDASTDSPTDDTSDSSGKIDAISGATISSAAVVDGINKAQSFIKDFVLTK
jgi:major membrane immunogen (membrane-anchored lipoprotein)